MLEPFTSTKKLHIKVVLSLMIHEPIISVHSLTEFGEHFSDENGVEDHCLGGLEEIDISEDLKMDGVEYLGPQVIDG